MPDIFFSDHVMKQAEKMARTSDNCKVSIVFTYAFFCFEQQNIYFEHFFNLNQNRIMIDRNTTGHQNDPESRLWYFREDIGVNSHHFHWLVNFF